MRPLLLGGDAALTVNESDVGLDTFLSAPPAPAAPPQGRPPLNLDTFLGAQSAVRPLPAAPPLLSQSLPTPEEADQHTTVIGRAIAEQQTRPAPIAPPAPPAPAGPSIWDRAKGVVSQAWQTANTHSIGALGGSTMTQLWEMAGHSAKNLVESTLGEPWEATRANLPAPAKTAEFLYHASKVIPGIVDFLFTPGVLCLIVPAHLSHDWPTRERKRP